MKDIVDQFVEEGVMSILQEAPALTCSVRPAALLTVCERLHKAPTSYVDMLSSVIGLDNGASAGTLEVIYQLYSVPFNNSLTLKVTLDREDPEVQSVVSVWRSANWMEREVFDLLGVVFSGHPDLRKILTPHDWEGYPLRKDYTAQAYYRGVSVMDREKNQ